MVERFIQYFSFPDKRWGPLGFLKRGNLRKGGGGGYPPPHICVYIYIIYIYFLPNLFTNVSRKFLALTVFISHSNLSISSLAKTKLSQPVFLCSTTINSSLQKFLFDVKKYGGRGWGGGDHEFWYISSEGYYLLLLLNFNIMHISSGLLSLKIAKLSTFCQEYKIFSRPFWRYGWLKKDGSPRNNPVFHLFWSAFR